MGIFSRYAEEVPCTVEVSHRFESLHAHVRFNNGAVIYLGDEVLVHGKPIRAGETIAAFGGRCVTRDELELLSGSQQRRSIQIDDTSSIDPGVTAVEDWPDVAALGTVVATGSYAFAATLDLTTVATRRFESDIEAASFDTGDLIDARVNDIDDWDSIDGSVVNDCDVTLYASVTNDNPAGAPTWATPRPRRWPSPPPATTSSSPSLSASASGGSPPARR